MSSYGRLLAGIILVTVGAFSSQVPVVAYGIQLAVDAAAEVSSDDSNL